MDIKDNKNRTNSLDYKIIGEQNNLWIVEAGLPYLLSIPKESVTDGKIGEYIMLGRQQFTQIVSSEKDHSEKAEELKAHISEGKPIELILKYINRKNGFYVLTSPNWPGFSFSTKWLNYTDRYSLENGKTVEMIGRKTKGGIAPEVETIPYIPVQSIEKETPQKYGVYKAVVTYVSSARLTVECNGRPGYIDQNNMNPDWKYETGMFLDVKCIYADHTGKVYNYRHIITEASENTLRKNTIISGTINHFDEDEGTLYVNFDKYINRKTFCAGSLNAASWIASGLFGEEIRLRINKVLEGTDCPYTTELLLPENKDPYNLPVGTKLTIDYSPGDKYIRFVHNGRQYGLYKESVYIPEFLKGILKDSVSMNGIVIKAYGSTDRYSDPDVVINSYTQFCADHSDEASKEFEAEIIGNSDTGIVVRTSDGYYINIPDNKFDHHWPKYHRPATGDMIKCLYDTLPESRNPDKKEVIPLYDSSSETEYTLPQGCYAGKVIRAYLNDRFVVETKQGPITAVCDAPPYIQNYFYRNNTPADVETDADGNAVMRFSGVNYSAPGLKEGAEVHVTPVARVSNGILVEFENDGAKCYGYIYAEDFAWTHFFDIDLDEELRRLSTPGKIVMARRITKPDKTGIFFTLKNLNENPYKAPEFDNLQPGSEVEVTVVKYLKYDNLLVEYNGIRGIIFSNYTGRFRIQSNRPARYVGERIKARVQEFDRDRGTLEFRAKAVNYERIHTRLEKGKRYSVTVRGHAGSNVIVQCGDIIGSLSNTKYLYEKIFVTPEHFPVGTEIDAVCKKYEFKNNGRTIYCLFSVTDEWIKNFYKISTHVLYEETVKGRVAGFTDRGLIMTFPFREYPKAYGIMPHRAALENVEGVNAELRNIYHIGQEIDIIPAYPVQSERTVYVIPANCRLREEYRKAKQGNYIVRGTISSFDRAEGYTVALDNGLTAFMNADSSSHSLWYTDILPTGVAMDFLMYGADFIRYRPLLSRKAVIDNPWDTMYLKEGDVTDITVEGTLGNLVVISYLGVHDYIEPEHIANFAGQPWNKSYTIINQDFPKGKVLKARVVKADVSKRHNILVPQLGYLHGDMQAEVVHVDSDGLWVKLSDTNGTVGFVPDTEISHAKISAADRFFNTGDKFHVRFTGMDKKGFTPQLSRKALLDGTPVKPQGKPVMVTLRCSADGNALVLAFGREIVLPETALIPTGKDGEFTVDTATFNKLIKKA